LRPLLDQAVEYVPHSSWDSTPLALKATAGFRLLSDQTAQQLLKEVGIFNKVLDLCFIFISSFLCLQCFDTVGWVALKF